MTGRSEAGIISSLSLLIHLIPYLSDASLMDILQVGFSPEFLTQMDVNYRHLVCVAGITLDQGLVSYTFVCLRQTLNLLPNFKLTMGYVIHNVLRCLVYFR